MNVILFGRYYAKIANKWKYSKVFIIHFTASSSYVNCTTIIHSVAYCIFFLCHFTGLSSNLFLRNVICLPCILSLTVVQLNKSHPLIIIEREREKESVREMERERWNYLFIYFLGGKLHKGMKTGNYVTN